MYVPYPSTFWKSSPNVWKNSNGLANQKPNVSKMFAWVFVELIRIQPIGISVKIANTKASVVSRVTVPRRSPYSSTGISLSRAARRSRRRRWRRDSGGGPALLAGGGGAVVTVMRTLPCACGR